MQIDPLNSMTPIAATPVRSEDQTVNKQLATAVKAINQAGLYGQDRQLQFAKDPNTKRVVIQIVQSTTGEVVQQIPPESVIEAFQALQQMQAKETGA